LNEIDAREFIEKINEEVEKGTTLFKNKIEIN
jgi:hypothetical protein